MNIASGDGETDGAESLAQLAAQAAGCTVCAAHLPLGPRPIFRVAATTRLLIVSQAPSTGAHRTGVPWTDASGDRLRGWLGLDRRQFFDPARIGILPVGFCYPGRLPGGGDAPPRPECAVLWHARMIRLMPDIRLTLLVGGAAQSWRLGPGRVGDRVRHFAACPPDCFPLPHPSWRTVVWERRHPWFATDVVPVLRHRVAAALQPAFTPPSAQA